MTTIADPIVGYAVLTDPTPAMIEQDRKRSRHRLERDNASVDHMLADDGACAQIRLPTGRVCRLEHHHSGSCEFEAPTLDSPEVPCSFTE